MPSLTGVCFTLAELFDGPNEHVSVLELPGKLALWLDDGDQMWCVELPPDGGPEHARCFICGVWCWSPMEPGNRDDDAIVCMAHGLAEWDAAGLI